MQYLSSRLHLVNTSAIEETKINNKWYRNYDRKQNLNFFTIAIRILGNEKASDKVGLGKINGLA